MHPARHHPSALHPSPLGEGPGVRLLIAKSSPLIALYGTYHTITCPSAPAEYSRVPSGLNARS